ncbi:hypothetical protein IV203_021087 [Nitzschia inconspicua]|uniref:Uncharacterized protein n=1 Tax=Nitzschia inconspicua TaxID=303405 RepID=A0A9K3KGA2_9STRA|nr:hypothetical protein IV203_021087 [Nitzschia inconspicua]
MPRFSDQWLIDRTLFDYVQGGSCACCAFNFLPNGTVGLIHSMSEFETDAADAEVSALDKLPWPPDMKDQVWIERVRLRQYCKGTMKMYKQFWNEHGEAFEVWFMRLPKESLCRYFQLPRTEILERLQQEKFHMHASFGTVLCAVTEQVAHFQLTQYPADGRGSAEIGFEEILAFDRRGGFTIRDDSTTTREKWLARHKGLGGPKLLERKEKASSRTNYDSDDSEADNDASAGTPETNEITPNETNTDVPSFRSDRRIVRWMIARCFADTLQQAFLKQLVA